MLCAVESLGCCSSTLSDNFAAQRLLLNAINGCSRSAAVKFWVATKSFLLFAKTAARAKAVWIRRRLLSGECGDSIKTLMGERECLRRCFFLKLLKTQIS